MKLRDSPHQNHNQWKEEELELWKARRGISRTVLKPVAMLSRRKDKIMQARIAKGKDPTGGKKEEVKNAVVATALLLAVVTAVARLGGRAAVMSMMGLDILQDTGISSQLNSVMETVEGLGEGEKLVVFFCLWVVAKSVCLDALALVLTQLNKRPLLRALERAVAKDGIKAVFTFRLSPLVPALPIGGYNYLYGVS
ncbi:hypothetical protein VYU27_010210, partial [Nannochloropsis oceanica]